MIEEPTPTHPVPPTLDRDETSEEAKKLWMDLRDVLHNDQAWYICQEAVDIAYWRGYAAGIEAVAKDENP